MIQMAANRCTVSEPLNLIKDLGAICLRKIPLSPGAVRRTKHETISGCKADFEDHLGLRALVAGRRVRDPREVPHQGLLGKLKLEPREEHAKYDLYQKTTSDTGRSVDERREREAAYSFPAART